MRDVVSSLACGRLGEEEKQLVQKKNCSPGICVYHNRKTAVAFQCFTSSSEH